MKRQATAFVAMALIAAQAQAQHLYDDIISIEQVGLKTTSIFEKNGDVTTYEGTELHTGIINADVVFNANNEEGKELEAPVNPYLEVSLTDPYGRKPFNITDSTFVPQMFAALEFIDELRSNQDIGHAVKRGGQYLYNNYIPGMDYSYEETVVVNDEPSVCLSYGSVKVGEDIKVKATYNTGYPFDINQFKDGKQATMQLYAVGKDEQGNMTETEVVRAQKPLRLYRPDQPLVAAIDYLQLNYFDAEPGEYHLKMSSDWTYEDANRDDIIIIVNDTLRASARLSKSRYLAGTDNGLTLHVKMNYGYPYIRTVEPDKTPTVRINTLVTAKREENGEQKTDTLVNMTTPITDAALAENALDWENDIVTTALESHEAAPLTTSTMNAQVSIEFNDKKQFSTTIPFTYVPATSTDVKRASGTVPAADASDVWYDIQGRKADSAAKGIYVSQGQKIAK